MVTHQCQILKKEAQDLEEQQSQMMAQGLVMSLKLAQNLYNKKAYIHLFCVHLCLHKLRASAGFLFFGEDVM